MTADDPAVKVQSQRKGLNDGLGFRPNEVVQEFYHDDDVDETLRDNIETLLGTQLVDEGYHDVSDGAIIWWRAGDGEIDDLADSSVDAMGNLDSGGSIWVLMPRAGVKNTVATQFVEEAAETAGLCILPSPHVSA